LCVDIVCYSNNAKNFFEFKSKAQVFFKPIVIEVNKSEVWLLYTKSQAFCFVNGTDKSKFSKNDVLEKQKIVEEQKVIKEDNKFDASSYIKEINLLFELLEDLLSRLCKFIGEVANSYKEQSKIKFCFENLLNSDFACKNTKNNIVLQKTIANFEAKVDKYLHYFENKKSLNADFENLISKEDLGQVINCVKCKDRCEPYKSFKFNCSHVLHAKCFESFLNTGLSLNKHLDFSTSKCTICESTIWENMCTCGSTTNVITLNSCMCKICQSCLKR